MAALVDPHKLPDFVGGRVKEAAAILLCDLASDVVRSYCGWRIDQATETLRARGPRTDGWWPEDVMLPTLRINEVLEVRAAGAVVQSAYVWTDNGVLTLPGLAGSGMVEVDLDHGYTQIPGDVQAVVLSMAKRNIVNPQGIRSLTLETGYAEVYAVPGTGENIDLALSSTEQRILDRHRIFPA